MATVIWEIPTSDNWEDWKIIFKSCRLFVQIVRSLEERIINGEITQPEAARALRRAVETWVAAQGDPMP